MTDPVIQGRAGRTPLPVDLQDSLCLLAEGLIDRRSHPEEEIQGATKLQDVDVAPHEHPWIDPSQAEMTMHHLDAFAIA